MSQLEQLREEVLVLAASAFPNDDADGDELELTFEADTLTIQRESCDWAEDLVIGASDEKLALLAAKAALLVLTERFDKQAAMELIAQFDNRGSYGNEA
jgi:hypothetical protein